MKDPHGFLRGVDQGCNHRPLLLMALEATDDSHHPVIELGMGSGSTYHLHNYCTERCRPLLSVDTSEDFCDSFRHLETNFHSIGCVGRVGRGDWNWAGLKLADRKWSVALVDHGHAEHRHIEALSLKDSCQIVVIHDSEPEATGYLLDRIWHLFKYRVDIKDKAGAWASAVSNVVDLNGWRGKELGGYVIE